MTTPASPTGQDVKPLTDAELKALRAAYKPEDDDGNMWPDNVGRLLDTIDTLTTSLAAEKTRADEAVETKDAAYLERNKLVALLARLFPSGTKRTAIEGWSDDWHGCVYIDLPTGQASWHYHDSQQHLFDDRPQYLGTWDGHTTDEKYERIARCGKKQHLPHCYGDQRLMCACPDFT